jgi:hypothetical protein
MRKPILHGLSAIAMIGFGVFAQNKITALLFGIAAGIQIVLAIFTFRLRDFLEERPS